MPVDPLNDEFSRGKLDLKGDMKEDMAIKEYETLDAYSVTDLIQIRILLNKETGTLLYKVVLPELGSDESATLEWLRDSLFSILERSSEIPNVREREKYLSEKVASHIERKGLNLEEAMMRYLQYLITRDYLGYGKIDPLMKDGNVEDISCDGIGIPIYVYHRKYQYVRTNLIFDNGQELNNFIVYLAQKGNKQISVSDPILDASTPEGNRINATFGNEVTPRGGTFTIRLFKEVPFTPTDLVMLKTASPELLAYLWLAIENGRNIIVLGGTGVGKTSTLNAIALFVPPNSKVVSIEDTKEINIPHRNWISAVTRSGVGEGRFVTGKAAGEIDMFDLLVSALRQRPDYMIVGEVRGKEAYNLFQAMTMGQTTLTTMHAESIDDLILRLENRPLNIPRTMLTSINCVVKQSMVKLGGRKERRITEVSEIVRLDPESNELIFNTIFSWDPTTDKILFSGKSHGVMELAEGQEYGGDRIRDELERRADVIRSLAEKNVTSYTEIWDYLRSYSVNPSGLYTDIKRGIDSGRD